MQRRKCAATGCCMAMGGAGVQQGPVGSIINLPRCPPRAAMWEPPLRCSPLLLQLAVLSQHALAPRFYPVFDRVRLLLRCLHRIKEFLGAQCEGGRQSGDCFRRELAFGAQLPHLHRQEPGCTDEPT